MNFIFLLTPKGDLCAQEPDVNVKSKLLYKDGNILRRTEETKTTDAKPEPDDPNDPILPGKPQYPWKWDKLPSDLKPQGKKDITINVEHLNCIGCYAELPRWLSGYISKDNKTIK